MIVILFFSLPIASLILYVNTVALLKKIRKGKEAAGNTFWGSVLFAYIIFGLVLLITTSSEH